MPSKVARRDRAIAKTASRQRGVITASQLREVGLGRAAVAERAAAGRLHRIHQGVYAVGHKELSTQGQWVAAILACGRKGGSSRAHGNRGDDGPHRSKTVLDFWGAALSHRSAAVHWGLLHAGWGTVDVTVPGHGGKTKREGVRLHRSRTLRPTDVTLREGIPVTTPARTIADLRRAATLRGERRFVSPKELRRAARQADVLGLPIGAPPERDGLRSDLEGDFREICRRHGLPEPEANVRVGRYLVDFLWHERRLIVETDSYLYHRGETAFEDDHSRDFELRRLGYRVERLSEGQLDAEPGRIARWLADELARP